jgi:hypothetical protein
MPIHHLQLDSTLGAAYVGNIVAAVYVQSSFCYSCLTVTPSLYGMTNVQTFIFFKNSERDRWPLKLIVSLCLAALLQTINLIGSKKVAVLWY